MEEIIKKLSFQTTIAKQGVYLTAIEAKSILSMYEENKRYREALEKIKKEYKITFEEDKNWILHANVINRIAEQALKPEPHTRGIRGNHSTKNKS